MIYKRNLIFILSLLLCGNVCAREKSDIIWLLNGDRITGEIKQLEHGILRVSTDSLGNVSVQWEDIAKIDSDYAFQFERSDGARITGQILKTEDQKKIQLANEEETSSFAHENVVRITQIDNSFWERLKGSLSFGYSFTKASDVAQGNLGFRATHRTEIRSFTLEGSTITTNDQAGEGTQRSEISLAMTRFRQNRWFNTYWLGFESNDELGLDLRSSLGTGIGRFLIQTNTSELSLIGGVVGNIEKLEDQAGLLSTKENVEGLIGVNYSRYIFDNPTLDFSSSILAFPSITESGRTRANLDVKLRWEIYDDLYWDLSYYNTYDSNPQTESSTDPSVNAASTSDYGVVTSIGWSF